MKRTWNKMKISRQSEAEFPEFDSHENARKFLKNKYGDSFVMANSEMINDEKVYFYHLILEDRKSTRLNSSHVAISYAVFCLKKKTRSTTIWDNTVTPTIRTTPAPQRTSCYR